MEPFVPTTVKARSDLWPVAAQEAWTDPIAPLANSTRVSR